MESMVRKLAKRIFRPKAMRSALGKLDASSDGFKSSKGRSFATGYVEVSREEIEERLNNSWKDESIPQTQFDMYTKEQLENYRRGLPVEPYDVLVSILKDNGLDSAELQILEVGCSTGYYSEVLQIKGICAEYHGCDYSEPFIEFARGLYPGTDFQAQDACSLSHIDNSFNVVISGCCILHIMDYEKAISEAARVASEYVVFHRTPVLHKKDTSYYIKTAYGVEMFETHFNERELFKIMKSCGLSIVDIITFDPICSEPNSGDLYAQKTYLCKKG